MARLAVPTAETSIRLYLIAEAEAFREICAGGQAPETRDAMWAELTGPIDALAAGEAWDIHRYELPDDHPAAQLGVGTPNDWLTLGADDRLRLAD